MIGTEAGKPLVVYQLRVVLAGISPLIWRRLLVTGQTTIAGLHQVLQTVFGWSDEHLHRFVVHGCEYGLWRPGSCGFSHDAHTVTLARFGLREGERFTYEYDFFDAWRHDIRVEKILTAQPSHRYPVCTGGARAAPPEDCGGPQAFLALRQEHSACAIAVRMAELLVPLLDEPDGERVVGGYLAGHLEEMAACWPGAGSTTSTALRSTTPCTPIPETSSHEDHGSCRHRPPGRHHPGHA